MVFCENNFYTGRCNNYLYSRGIIVLAVKPIIYGHLETICRIFIHQEKGPKRPSYRLDEIHAWHQPNFHYYVLTGYHCTIT